MSSHSLDKIFLCKKFWIALSIVLMGIYLYPLLSGHLHTIAYDNLDSNVVWNKILAHSGKIFAPSEAIIPNMMQGLPRGTYGSEFDLLLWLYYFFTPQTAYILNELLIHLIAFIGAYLLLSRYIVPAHKHYSTMLIFAGTLYFATLPLWSGAGASIASLPLTTYVLLDIRNRRDTRWHWLYLVLLPFYSSLVLIYMFYLIYAGIYWLYVSIRERTIHYPLIGAIVLLGVVFLLKEYRLVYSMFIDSGFVSHRVEFDVYFIEDLFETYRLTLVKFLEGHGEHAAGLQLPYLIPLSITALLLSFYPTRFSPTISAGVWILLFLSFYADWWHTLLINRYLLPVLLALSLIKILLPRQRHKTIGYLLFAIILLSAAASLTQYKGLHWVTETLPLFKSLNITRLYFIEPMLLMVLYVLALQILIRKLRFSYSAIVLIVGLHYIFALEHSFYKLTSQANYLTFDEYYAPKTFDKIKQDIQKTARKPLEQIHVLSYGLEPAVALYNGLYTADGYSANYPLEYKKRFRKILMPYLDAPTLTSEKKMFDEWGSKLYVITMVSLPETYRLYVDADSFSTLPLNADLDAICDLQTEYLISSHPLRGYDRKRLELVNSYRGDFWRVWLYHLMCDPRVSTD